MKRYDKYSEDRQIQDALDVYNKTYTKKLNIEELLLTMIISCEVTNDLNILIKRKIGINHKNKFGNSPLLVAIENIANISGDYYETITKLLIDNGADINIQNRKGTTPLILTMRLNIVNIFFYLLEQDNINLNIKDNKNLDIFDYLSDKYIDIIKDKYSDKYNKYLRNKKVEKFNI
jgi:ankyrin repeat protein